MNRSSGEPSSLSPSSRMGLARISWNSVRVFSKSRTGAIESSIPRNQIWHSRRIAYAHSIVGTPASGAGNRLISSIETTPDESGYRYLRHPDTSPGRASDVRMSDLALLAFWVANSQHV